MSLRLIKRSMAGCAICGKPVIVQNYGYGVVTCSVACFREAGKKYKPNRDRNRGGGVGKERVTI